MESINIVFARIDNRLIHGQIAMVWANLSNANLILVVDDEVANDDLQKSIMQMSVASTGIGVRFWSVEKTIRDIWKAAPHQKIFIVTKTPSEMRQLIDGGVPIKHVNIGNMHSAPNKRLLAGEYVYVDDKRMKKTSRQ